MAWKVPLFDLDVGEQEADAARKALKSGWISMGEATQELERRFAEAHHANYAVAVSSATAALHLALRACDVGPGDEVICPSLTFVATANAALYVGARPVFAEITSCQELTISPEDIEAKVTDKTRVIIVMHYGGFPCDMDPIVESARRHGIAVVEDAAHAPLAEYKGRMVGTLGDVGCFSFFSNKNMTTAEGGMALTNDAATAERIRLMRSHGMTTLSYDRFNGHASAYDVVDLGYNYRLDDIRASIGLVQLDKLEAMNTRRRQLWKLYCHQLADIEGIVVPFGADVDISGRWLSHPYILSIILTYGHDRDRIREMLAERGIQTSVHYPPVHLFSIYRERFDYRPGDLPVTEQIASSIITLPFYPSMTVGDVHQVIEALKGVL